MSRIRPPAFHILSALPIFAASVLSLVAAALLLAPVACGNAGEVESIDLQAVYDRTDRDFESAVLFRPDDAAEGEPFHTLAPLLVFENGVAGSDPPEVTYEQTSQGWAYRWTDPVSGIEQGIHGTLGEDGFPTVYEVRVDSSGAALLFVDQTLEQAAAGRYGPPLPGRRFSVERDVGETPNVVVGAVFEPGSTPLGPFVYLWRETHDVNVVLCRCMEPRVYDIVDSIAYELKPGDTSGWRPSKLDEALRLPADH